MGGPLYLYVKKDCDSMLNGKHKEVAKRGPSGKKETWSNQIRHKQKELYIIPSLLLQDIFVFIVNPHIFPPHHRP